MGFIFAAKRLLGDLMLIVKGYHGTTQSRARELVAGSPFEFSANSGDWLGRGIYFWQDAPGRALVWARYRHRDSGETPAVVEVEITLENCLDFFDVRTYREVRQRYPEFQAFESRLDPPISQAALKVEKGKAFLDGDTPTTDIRTRKAIHNYRDRAFIDWYVEVLANRGYEVKTVRGIFLDGTALFTESFLFDWSHAQIAVLNHDVLSPPKIWNGG